MHHLKSFASDHICEWCWPKDKIYLKLNTMQPSEGSSFQLRLSKPNSNRNRGTRKHQRLKSAQSSFGATNTLKKWCIVNGEALWVLDAYEIMIKEIDDGKKKTKHFSLNIAEYL